MEYFPNSPYIRYPKPASKCYICAKVNKYLIISISNVLIIRQVINLHVRRLIITTDTINSSKFMTIYTDNLNVLYNKTILKKIDDSGLKGQTKLC